MEVFAHRRVLGHRGERLRSHVLRMRAREAHAADAVDRPDRVQQIGEQRSEPGRRVAALAGGELQITAVAVHVLAQQRHLGDAFGGELLDLGDDLVERTAHLHTADGGHDAEGAAVVATDLDGHPHVVRRVPTGRQGRGEHGVVVDHRFLQDLGDRPVGALRPRAGARRRDGRCACPSRRRRGRPWRRPAPGPSGRGSRTRRSGGRPSCPSRSSGGRGCRTACCRRSPGCSTC